MCFACIEECPDCNYLIWRDPDGTILAHIVTKMCTPCMDENEVRGNAVVPAYEMDYRIRSMIELASFVTGQDQSDILFGPRQVIDVQKEMDANQEIVDVLSV